jgi:hypothetical protein
VKINHITAYQEHTQVLMVQGYTGDQRIQLVAQIYLPVFTNPGKLIVDPDAKTAVFALYMVFLPDMREIEITYVVMLIEADKEFAVSNRYISRHLCIPLKE